MRLRYLLLAGIFFCGILKTMELLFPFIAVMAQLFFYGMAGRVLWRLCVPTPELQSPLTLVLTGAGAWLLVYMLLATALGLGVFSVLLVLLVIVYIFMWRLQKNGLWLASYEEHRWTVLLCVLLLLIPLWGYFMQLPVAEAQVYGSVLVPLKALLYGEVLQPGHLEAVLLLPAAALLRLTSGTDALHTLPYMQTVLLAILWAHYAFREGGLVARWSNLLLVSAGLALAAGVLSAVFWLVMFNGMWAVAACMVCVHLLYSAQGRVTPRVGVLLAVLGTLFATLASPFVVGAVGALVLLIWLSRMAKVTKVFMGAVIVAGFFLSLLALGAAFAPPVHFVLPVWALLPLAALFVLGLKTLIPALAHRQQQLLAGWIVGLCVLGLVTTSAKAVPQLSELAFITSGLWGLYAFFTFFSLYQQSALGSFVYRTSWPVGAVLVPVVLSTFFIGRGILDLPNIQAQQNAALVQRMAWPQAGQPLPLVYLSSTTAQQAAIPLLTYSLLDVIPRNGIVYALPNGGSGELYDFLHALNTPRLMVYPPHGVLSGLLRRWFSDEYVYMLETNATGFSVVGRWRLH